MVVSRPAVKQARVYDPALLASLARGEEEAADTQSQPGTPRAQQKPSVKSAAGKEDVVTQKTSPVQPGGACPKTRKPPVPLKSNSRRRHRQEDLEVEMLQNVFSSFLGEDGVIKDAQETLNVADQVLRRRREKLHADWSQNVHGKIQKRIHDVLRNMSVEDIEKKLRTGLQDYLNTSNIKKAAVFRDVIIEADYNPLKYATRNIKFRTDDIKDPCQLDEWKAKREASLMGGTETARELGKTILPTVLWDKLDSTPYGRNMLPDGSYVIKPVDQKLAELQKSHIFMDHYNTPTGKEVVDSEIPKGKGVAKPDSTGLPNFFEIFQRVDESKTQSELVAQGKAVGDHWLSHRGRKIGEGPEVRRGRKNLFDVVQHNCVEGLQQNPHFTGGDMWLEARGKANAPGPEQLRGRQNLFETFQQSSNPYIDGRTLDDSVLEGAARGKLAQFQQKESKNDMYKVLQDAIHAS